MKFVFLDVGLVLIFTFVLTVLVSRWGSVERPVVVNRPARHFSEKPAPDSWEIGDRGVLTLQ